MKKIAVTTLIAVASGMALGSMVAAHAADLSSYDKTFIMKAADSGATEISASKAVSGKTATPAVKSFADTMVTDHTKVADELKQLASTKGVTVSDAPSSAHQAEIGKMNGLNGKDLDKSYAKNIGVSAHKDAVKLFADASKKANDPDIKAFAAKTLPALQHHLEMANDLNTTVAKE
jgi:putative membrane protein